MTRFLLVAALVAGGCAATAQTAEEAAFARAFLGALQERSFARSREYCGYFGYDRDGTLVAVKPEPGQSASCSPRWPHSRITVIASYHTHGAWDDETDGEVPSIEDVEGDMEDGIDGYISTPGGRFWFVDGETGESRQLCDHSCLLADPEFEREGAVPLRLTLEELRVRQGD